MIAAIRVYPSILYMLHNKSKRQEVVEKRREPRQMYQERYHKRKKKKERNTRKERRKDQGSPDNAAKSYARILLPSVHPNKKAPGIYLTVS